MQEIVSVWKDAPKVVAQYDKNRNNKLDFEELLEMHKAAREVAVREESNVLAEPPVHLISCPDFGQRFIISTFQPDRLVNQYRYHLLLGFILFFGGLAGCASLVLSWPRL